MYCFPISTYRPVTVTSTLLRTPLENFPICSQWLGKAKAVAINKGNDVHHSCYRNQNKQFQQTNKGYKNSAKFSPKLVHMMQIQNNINNCNNNDNDLLQRERVCNPAPTVIINESQGMQIRCEFSKTIHSANVIRVSDLKTC